ncbi:uncharacterized protein BKCO1_43000106 [Diplodia corticola]|uniref:Uncharacterized protein n=1 Tax=Diplodia corticola TaxID=236234 RepID=A0A1J9QU01_9PEZI|nr:uncharacterized protein BKCO1_43000106 [Diplodia corticola]OJD31881.1 hypothetical protein BKCO1_43000106 [Diplodia corticola]
MSRSTAICPICGTAYYHENSHARDTSMSLITPTQRSSSMENRNTALAEPPITPSSLLQSYSPDLCLECARYCARTLTRDYKRLKEKLFAEEESYRQAQKNNRSPPSSSIKGGNGTHASRNKDARSHQKKLEKRCKQLRTLLCLIRKTKCRVANADLAEERRREELAKIVEEANGLIDGLIDGDMMGAEEAGKLRMELKRLYAEAVGATEDLNVDQEAKRAKDGAKSTARKVSFAPGLFDELDPVVAEPRGRRGNGYFRRISPEYQPGVYARKAYYDTSGFLQDPDEYGKGVQTEYPKYQPVRTLNWIAEPSTYATPMVILTDELGNSRTLVRATLPSSRSVPFTAVMDPKIHVVRLVSSRLIQQKVDDFLNRPKPKKKWRMELHHSHFLDDFGMERELSWIHDELWIKTSYTKRKGGEKITKDIHSEPWHESVRYAKRQEAFRVICGWAKKGKTERTGSFEGTQRTLVRR